MSKPFTIAFFGLPLAAILLQRDGHHLAFVGVCRRDSLGLRRLQRLYSHEIVIEPNAHHPSVLEQIKQIQPDLIVSWFWTKRLPMSILQLARYGGIGVHPSLLPRHRGPDPTYWTLALGDTISGVTAHTLEAEYDTGAILDQEILSIHPTWNAWQLAKALDRPSLRVLRRIVQRFSIHDIPTVIPQDESQATLAPFPTMEECAIRWNTPTEQILRHIRALAPSPAAWTEIRNQSVSITRAEEMKKFPAILQWGEASVYQNRPIIRTSDGAIVPLEGDIDGIPSHETDFKKLFS